jgi:hypothetical protein
VKVKNEACRTKDKYDHYLVPESLSGNEKWDEAS